MSGGKKQAVIVTKKMGKIRINPTTTLSNGDKNTQGFGGGVCAKRQPEGSEVR